MGDSKCPRRLSNLEYKRIDSFVDQAEQDPTVVHRAVRYSVSTIDEIWARYDKTNTGVLSRKELLSAANDIIKKTIRYAQTAVNAIDPELCKDPVLDREVRHRLYKSLFGNMPRHEAVKQTAAELLVQLGDDNLQVTKEEFLKKWMAFSDKKWGSMLPKEPSSRKCVIQ